jgi:hypothetical protein
MMKRGFRSEEKIRGSSFPGLLLLAGIALELVVLSAAASPEKSRSQVGASVHNQLSRHAISSSLSSGPVLIAYDKTERDKQLAFDTGLSGTVIRSRKHGTTTDELRVEKLERTIQGPRPWKGEPVVAEPTQNSSLPYVSP